MSRTIDLEITRVVRKVLVRHWIDLGKLSVSTINSNCTIRGSLERVADLESEQPLTPSLVKVIQQELERIRAIRILRFYLENWTNESGAWCRCSPPPITKTPEAAGQLYST